MQKMILIVALAAALLCAGCAREPGSREYKAWAREHLDSLELVDMAGRPKTEPDLGRDYDTLPDFAAIADTKARKEAFFEYLRPAVEYRNALNRERRVLLGGVAIRLEHELPLSDADRTFMTDVRRRYRIPEELSDAEAVPELRRRMDTIPESMVLAQAAIESGWGRSRFAREANNLFGQWCFEAGCGVVPKRRVSGAKHEVASFDTVEEAIASYFRNINTHPVYEPVRDLREQARESDSDISGEDLAGGLYRYSERGNAYIEEVRQVIRINDLEPRRG